MSTDQVQQEKIYEDEIDLVQLIRSVWRFKWLLVGLVIVAVLAAGMHNKFFTTPVYRSEAILQSDSAKTISHIINSATFKENLIIEINQNNEIDKIRSAVHSLEAETEEGLIDITTKSPDPEVAYVVLQHAIKSVEGIQEQRIGENRELKLYYLETIREQIEINEQVIAQTEEQIEALLSYSAATFDTDYLLGILTANLSRHVERRLSLLGQEVATSEEIIRFPVRVISEPYLPVRSEGAGLFLNVAIAAVLALMLGLFIVFVKVMFEDYDNRNKEV